MLSRLLYTLLFYSVMPFVLLRLSYRAVKAPDYAKRWRERFGWFTPRNTRRPAIWVHSVSVGETLAAIPLINKLQECYPQHQLVVTTMTPTGSAQVKSKLGDKVFHVYAPYDLPGAVQRFLAKIQPDLAIMMETELWPNTIAACHAQEIPVILANARLSHKSANGYAKFRSLVEPMLRQLSLVAAQDQASADRFKGLGVAADKVSVTGSIKFDLQPDQDQVATGCTLRQQWLKSGKKQAVWVAASTHPGEDEQVLRAHQQLLKTHPQVLLILVPRHPERFNQVATLIEQAGLRYIRRTSQQLADEQTQVILGDTMGELLMFFAACDVAFIGGSLVPHGGHNMLEASALGKPVLTGTHVFNFMEISKLLSESGGLLWVNDAETLVIEVGKLLKSPAQAEIVGQKGLQLVSQHRGAIDRLLVHIAAITGLAHQERGSLPSSQIKE
ncbi:lipid IV(A) 3-deoxy-D-manno-octulosonic acid transferase [Zooshikella ganghwensis]|uniref:lipid IV(A) 3-deoxy-D-manno-octulosonic acid transferase n=1 Tax=Zooshikella ganghwensis TaxID=202772 RepID=UPI001EEF5D74|nr:lipid IV(A) 3-deoxy-D-manno-octulosonic acid transferase [Zooshikella ganghwensis]